MEDQKNETPNNVIQFPGRKKEETAGQPAVASAKNPAKKPAKPRASKKTTAATVLALMLFTGAANRYVFESSKTDRATELASVNENGGRAIASVEGLKQMERVTWTRDAAWEKDLAERLASPQARKLASAGIGRAATLEEKLRWGVLEEKYTITYAGEGAHEIKSILLQGEQGTHPSYILDRPGFLREYGRLLQSGFDSAQLKSTRTADGKTIESYTLFGKDNRPQAEAQFELDVHKRLLSLKVEPARI